MLLSAYNLFGGAVNEASVRIRALREVAGDNILASPLVGMTHGVTAGVRAVDWRLRGSSIVSEARRRQLHRFP